MTDPDQRGEELDEAVGDDYPPDRPPRLDDDGGTEPEVWEAPAAGDDEGVELAGDPDVGAIDEEPELVGLEADRSADPGPLAEDDEFTGDETARDDPEGGTAPAEEAAVHVEDEE